MANDIVVLPDQLLAAETGYGNKIVIGKGNVTLQIRRSDQLRMARIQDLFRGNRLVVTHEQLTFLDAETGHPIPMPQTHTALPGKCGNRPENRHTTL
ncbi:MULTISPECIES: hypothetical protein [Microvirgula]|uniref:hypothetical protein n=1 Tax=Microvirgula TaxID=57479 RepID=UPI001B8026E2|nr:MULTISPECIES: hypothetical protein [Microvirgula]